MNIELCAFLQKVATIVGNDDVVVSDRVWDEIPVLPSLLPDVRHMIGFETSGFSGSDQSHTIRSGFRRLRANYQNASETRGIRPRRQQGLDPAPGSVPLRDIPSALPPRTDVGLADPTLRESNLMENLAMRIIVLKYPST